MPHHQLCIQYAVSDGADENSYDGLRAGRLGVYDLATRRSLRIPVPIQAIPPSFQVQPIAWSPDGLWIVVGSRGFAGLPTFRVYDAETMELAPGWAPPTGGWCNRVAASNAMIAIAYGSGGTVYSIATQQVLHTLTGTSQIYDMQLSVDGTRLVVCRSTAVQVYDTTTWSLIQTGLPATEYGSVAAISPDGAWLAMGHTVGATAHLRLFETVGWTGAGYRHVLARFGGGLQDYVARRFVCGVLGDPASAACHSCHRAWAHTAAGIAACGCPSGR